MLKNDTTFQNESLLKLTQKQRSFQLRQYLDTSWVVPFLAGLSIVLMAVIAGVSLGYLQQKIFFSDAAVQSITAVKTSSAAQFLPSDSSGLLIAELTGLILILLLDIALAWLLYRLFNPIQPMLAKAIGLLRLTYAVFFAMAILSLSRLLLPQAPTVAKALASFNHFWSIGLVVFGFHLLTIGLILLKGAPLPKLLGYLLIIAGCSYVMIHTGHLLLPVDPSTLKTMESILSLPMTLGELSFGIWLIVRAF